MRFRLVARDNHPGNGGHAWDEMLVTVSGAPLAATSPNGGDTLVSNVPFNVTWQVGGGSVAPTVNILISTDGGSSWQTLAAGVPNDGTETVSHLVANTSSSCRIKVEAAGNIFYDVSDHDFMLAPVAGVSSPTPRWGDPRGRAEPQPRSDAGRLLGRSGGARPAQRDRRPGAGGCGARFRKPCGRAPSGNVVRERVAGTVFREARGPRGVGDPEGRGSAVIAGFSSQFASRRGPPDYARFAGSVAGGKR